MHYNEHLGKQAISFLRKLMKTYGADRHQMPEYFEDYFFQLLDDYKSLKNLLICDYMGANDELNDVIKIMKQFRDRQGNSKDDVKAFKYVINLLEEVNKNEN